MNKLSVELWPGPIGQPPLLTEVYRASEVNQELARLRGALAGLLGTADPDELREMERVLRVIPGADASVAVDAIHALLGVTG